MDKKTLSIILGIILIASFFLPYLNLAGLFKVSAFDIIKGGGVMEGRSSKGSPDKYIMLLTPIAGVLLLIGALNNNFILGRVLLGILALVGILYPVTRMLIDSGGEGIGEIFGFLGIGFWLALVAGIVVIAYNPVKKTSNS
jgi:hypothetical protein